MKPQLPGITTPSGATHLYESNGYQTFYKVKSKRNIYRSFNQVWFWDRYRNIWVRSYAYPAIDCMKELKR